MNTWLRIAGWGVLGLVLLWFVLEIVSIVLDVVSWVISTAVSLFVVALLLYLAYLAVRTFTGRRSGNSPSKSGSKSREKLFE